jgi:hypothetical protein
MSMARAITAPITILRRRFLFIEKGAALIRNPSRNLHIKPNKYPGQLCITSRCRCFRGLTDLGGRLAPAVF